MLFFSWVCPFLIYSYRNIIYLSAYKFNIFYYRGKDKIASGENEIDLIIEENGVLYQVEIKMSGNPKANMAAANQILDKVAEKSRGMGIILCLIDKKTYLRENLIALPIEYI